MDITKKIFGIFFKAHLENMKTDEFEMIKNNITHTIQIFDIVSSIQGSDYDEYKIGIKYDNPHFKYNKKCGYKEFCDHVETKRCRDKSTLVFMSLYEDRDPNLPLHFRKIAPIYSRGATSYVCHFTGHGNNIVFNTDDELISSYDYIPTIGNSGYTETKIHFETLQNINIKI